MIKEYAVEPNCLTTWSDCRYIIEKFGYPHGRLISNYPENWSQLVREACVNLAGPVERKKIINYLIKYRKKITCSSLREYHNKLNWLENSEHVHMNVPFHAIIASSNPNANPQILISSDISEEDELFKTHHMKTVNRCIPAIISNLELFLKEAKNLIFIDPYFNRLAQRHTKLFVAFIETALKRKTHISLKKISYHFDDTIPKNNFIENVKVNRTLKKLKNLKIDFYMWPSKEMHNRFILSDKGGIGFQTGLDINEGNSVATDELTLLSNEVHQRYLQKFGADELKRLYTLEL